MALPRRIAEFRYHMANLTHIDPSASMRALVSALARGAGWIPSSHAGLPEARAAIRRQAPDLIVCATALPSLHLSDIVGILRAKPGLAVVPIVLFTGGKRPDAIASALEYGITEVFSKDEPEALLKYLEDVRPSHDRRWPPLRRALLLDDDRAMGGFIGGALQARGIATDVHRTIDSARRALAVGRYDIVIADIVLGGDRSGLSFVREIRQRGGCYAEIPVIAISGFLDAARRVESLRAGATLCLAKPFAETELAVLLEKALGNAPKTPPEAHCPGCPPDRPGAPRLTGREHLICRLAIGGTPDKEMARQLGISYWTVRTHMSRIFRKFGVANRVELASKCLAPEAWPARLAKP